MQMIEDITPLHDVSCKLRLPGEPASVRIVPEGKKLPFTYANNVVSFTIPRMDGHVMVEVV
jgi:hypothetical protein